MTESLHIYYLHKFIKPKNLLPMLERDNRTIDDVVSVIIEPDYYDRKMVQHSMPDYLFYFREGVWMPAELKGNLCAKNKAKKQLIEGKHYIEDVLQAPCLDYGYMVVYNAQHYDYRKLDI